ncbi:hypothetical protein ACH5RR_008087 [Cinchona calisaya]|uniref:Uncharacterized protein n=1 Tax=Cinchona calisaya TaxID=153742 RepID=A0ABD3AE87_9GENT
MPLPRLFHSCTHCNFYRTFYQVSFILPHSTSLFTLQENLSLIVGLNVARPFNSTASILSNRRLNHHQFRGFCCIIDGEVESELEDSNDVKGVNSKVDRLCKVINELFALNRNLESVLDECGIDLSHDLMVDVLRRF